MTFSSLVLFLAAAYFFRKQTPPKPLPQNVVEYEKAFDYPATEADDSIELNQSSI